MKNEVVKRRKKQFTTFERFMAKLLVADGCWLWEGALASNGYGSFWIGDRVDAAHRAAYQIFVGDIPAGLDLDHLCRNRRCVNPKHLEPVTRRVNLHRGETTIPAINARKTHCPQGHPYDRRSKLGRYCSRCSAESQRRKR